MRYGFCILPAIPMRVEPSDKSEMVSQLIFGDIFIILDDLEKWIQIQSTFDQYQGWIDKKQYLELKDSEEIEKICNWNHMVMTPVASVTWNGNTLWIPMGSKLPSEENILLSGFHLEQHITEPMDINIVSTAKQLLGAPYLWGGKTCMGIDCSGLTQTVFRVCGIKLPRDASEQATQGIPIHSITDAKINDLLFFKNTNEKIIHVGIYLGNNGIIHASGYVRIDTVDATGIYNKEIQKYTHQLACIRRFP